MPTRSDAARSKPVGRPHRHPNDSRLEAPRFVSQAVLALWLACAVPLTVSVKPAHGSTYPITRFDNLQGLIVDEVFQDSRGYIWLATLSGIWRGQRDGFQPISSPTAADPHIPVPTRWGHNARGFLEDDDGTLWIATDRGLLAIDMISLAPRPVPQPLDSRNVRCLHRDGTGRMWAGTTQGLFYWQPAASAAAQEVESTRRYIIFSIAQGDGDTLWLGANEAVLHVVDGHVERLLEDKVGDGPVCVFRASDGALWVGLRRPGGLFQLRDERWIQYKPADGLHDDDVNTIAEAPTGDMWFGTENGAYRYAEGRFVPIGRHEGLENTDIHSVLIDEEHQVWFGTFGSGACHLRSPYVRIYGSNEGLVHPMVTALGDDGAGHLIVGTIDGAGVFDPDRDRIVATEPNDQLRAVCLCEPHDVWLAGQRVVWRMGDPRSRIPMPAEVTCLGHNTAGQLLAGTVDGLYAVDGAGPRRVDLPTRKKHMWITSILATPDGWLYVTSKDGIVRRSAGEWDWALRDVSVFGLDQAPDGTIWVGTDATLQAYPPDFAPPTPIHTLATGQVDRVLCQDGTVWGGTGQGLLRVRDGRPIWFTRVDGLPSDDVRCLGRGKGGELYVGTTHGLARLDTDRLAPCLAPPRVGLEYWYAGETSGPSRDGVLRIPYVNQDLLLRAFCLGWRSAVGVQFQFRLDGRNTQWSEPTGNNFRRFSQLAPGTYTVRAKAVNANGVESRTAAALTFHVVPPFWREPWFVALASALLVVIAWMIVTLHRRRQQLHAEQRRGEALIRESEARYRLLAEHASDVISRHDLNGTYRYASPACRGLFGCQPDHLVGQALWDPVIPEDQDAVRERYHATKDIDASTPFVYRVRRADGAVRWVESKSQLVCDPLSGGPAERVVVTRDVTARHVAEDALRRSEDRLRRAIDNAPVMVNAFDDDRTLVFWNRECERVTGYAADEVVGNPKALELLYPDKAYRDRMIAEWRRRGDDFRDWEWHVTCKDGTEKIVAWTHQATRFPIPGWAHWGVGLDVTDQKRAQELVRLRQAELAHVSRLSTMGEIATELAHELNQPLAAVANYATGCVRRIEAGTHIDILLNPLGQIVSQANRAADVIRRVREFARKRDPQVSRININELAAESVDFVDYAAKMHGVSIRLIQEPQLPPVEVDAIQIQQVLLNLLFNAIDAMKERADAPRELHVVLAQHDTRWARVTVKDTGPGLSPAVRERMFDPYFTTKSDGTGLGLAISNTIIQAHRGHLWADPCDGEGAVLHFTLPIQEVE